MRAPVPRVLTWLRCDAPSAASAFSSSQTCARWTLHLPRQRAAKARQRVLTAGRGRKRRATGWRRARSQKQRAKIVCVAQTRRTARARACGALCSCARLQGPRTKGSAVAEVSSLGWRRDAAYACSTRDAYDSLALLPPLCSPEAAHCASLGRLARAAAAPAVWLARASAHIAAGAMGKSRRSLAASSGAGAREDGADAAQVRPAPRQRLPRSPRRR